GKRPEPRQVVSPPLRMRGRLEVRQAAVYDADPGPAALRGEGHLQRAGMGRKLLRAASAPGDHQAPGRIELKVASLDRHVSEEEGELSPWAGVEDRAIAHPPAHGIGPDPVVETAPGPGRAGGRGPGRLSGQGCPRERR